MLLGYRAGGVAPIVSRASGGAFAAAGSASEFLATAVDPLPQALVLTSIVIGLGVTTLAIALCVRLYEKYGTYDITEMRRLRG